jgi:hypothetical protein
VSTLAMRSKPSVLSGFQSPLLMASTVNLTSADVCGFPSCHFTPGRSFHVTSMPPSGPLLHTAVLERRNLDGENRNDVHLLVRRDEPLDDARLDVLENVRRVAIHRVRLAVVAHDEQVVRRSSAIGALGAPGSQAEDENGETTNALVR